MKNIYRVIFKCDDFIVIDKLSDFSFHSDQGAQAGLFSIVKEEFPGIISVHRLDKATSGLIVLALKKEVATQFTKLFSNHLVDKLYLAISDKKPKKKQGKIIGDLIKSRGGSYKLVNTKINPSISQFFSFSLAANRRLFVLRPHTGRTHQLRVHMRSIGAAILGDERYAQSISDRMYLHAYKLGFTLNEKSYEFISDKPEGELFMGINEKLQEFEIDKLLWPKLK